MPTPRLRFRRYMRNFTLPAILCFSFGVTLGFSLDEFYLESLSSKQVAFVDGVVSGAQFRKDYNDWKTSPSPSGTDNRADPARRCAAMFYPNNRDAMIGCLEAIDGRPVGGYNIP